MVSPLTASLEEALSAVMDGSATPEDWARVEAAWKVDPFLRERWTAWHAVGDGLRAPDLPTLQRDPEALLDTLRWVTPPGPARVPRSGWWAPLAVAASFVMAALGLGTWQPAAEAPVPLAAAPVPTALPEGLVGPSFAQAATAPRLPVDASAVVVTALPTLDWPQPAASSVHP